MYGRYTLTIDKRIIDKHFRPKFYIAEPSYDWSQTHNATPSYFLPVIRAYIPTGSNRASMRSTYSRSVGTGFLASEPQDDGHAVVDVADR